jgi:prepilin-type N-terminal cleavage/methylation domain-containing protein
MSLPKLKEYKIVTSKAYLETLKLRNCETNSGFTLLELVIASGVLLILAHAFFSLITTSYQLLGHARVQATARALANQQLETVRNLAFDDIGTGGGIPDGPLPQVQVINLNGQDFTVNTSVVYVDDPFDDVAPTDLLPTDYKQVKVAISWEGTFPANRQIEVITTVAPRGVESTAGGGTLAILVFDSQGQPVSQANIHIEAPAATPPVDLNLTTDSLGNLILPGAPVCTACYNLTVTKTDYSTDRTYSTAEVTNPDQPPATILEGQLTQVSFAIDLLADVTIRSSGNAINGFPTLPDTSFHLTSNKTIGTDSLGQAIYKLDQDYTTDGSGQLQLQLEWANYTLTVDNITYDLGGTNPVSPFSLLPNDNIEVSFSAVGHQPHTLLTIIQDASGSAIASAEARLYDGGSFDQTLNTGTTELPNFGQAFFSSLDEGDYTLEVTHPDYQTATSAATISDQTTQTLNLNPL